MQQPIYKSYCTSKECPDHKSYQSDNINECICKLLSLQGEPNSIIFVVKDDKISFKKWLAKYNVLLIKRAFNFKYSLMLFFREY